MATQANAGHGDEGLTVQRGGERFRLEKANDRFAVKKRSGAARGSLAAALASPSAFPGLTFQAAESPGEVEVYHVNADSLDEAMAAVRGQSPDAAWCGHVYHMPGDLAGQMVPTDEIYAEFTANADEETVNQLLDQHGLELIPADNGNPRAFVLRLTSASTQNPIKIASALARSGQVILAEPDFAVKADLKAYRPSDALFPSQWHLENLGGLGLTAGADVSAPEAWEISRGDRSIVVAVIDDSVQISHPEFSAAGKIVAPVDFGQNDLDPSPVTSGDRHGTACAGVAVAEENGQGVVGVAFDCALMPVRWSLSITDRTIRDWFDHARVNGASVISCSWGVVGNSFTLSTSMRNSIRRAAREGRGGRGSVVVFAAGNDNRPVNGVKDGVFYREGFAIHPDVIAVSASNSRDLRSNYSNYGPEIWVAAPSSGSGGRGIVTTDRTGATGYSSDDYTTSFGGTSSATPLVAGICALMLSVNPELSGAEVKEILRDTSEKIDQAGGNYDTQGHSDFYGWGRVDAFRAVQEARRRLAKPEITSPQPGSALPGSTAEFTWTSQGQPVTEWWLYAGSVQGQSDLFNSGSLGASLATTVTGLPTDESQIWVRLWFKINDAWASADFSYTAAPMGEPEMTTPPPSSALPGASVDFEWSPNGVPVAEWWLYAGSSQGTADHFNSGSLGTSVSVTVANLPFDGSQVSVRLWYRIGADWQFIDYLYTAASSREPALTTPPPGSVLSGGTVTFGWNPHGTTVAEWWLYIGSNKGDFDLFNSGSLGASLTRTVAGLPVDGRQLWVRLWHRTNAWQFTDYSYTARTL